MLWTIIGIVVFALLMVVLAGAEHIEKKAQRNDSKTITKRKMDGLQDIKDHEDHLES